MKRCRQRVRFVICCAVATTIGAFASVVIAEVPGVVVAHRASQTGVYIGSPSLAILDNGHYVASHDGFGPKHEFGRTYLYESNDRGASWTALPAVEGQGSSTLFHHDGALYLMGLGSRNVLIRKSTDGGNSWTNPLDAKSGILLSGMVYSTAPVPVATHDGRIWRAMEDAEGTGDWAQHFRAFMMSAPVNADLLDAKNWTSSEKLAGDTSWQQKSFDGWLEGNAVVLPDQSVGILLRTHCYSYDGNLAALIRVSDDGRKAGFDPQTGFVAMPGAAKKFTVRFDADSRHYWALTNFVPRRHRHGGDLHPGGNPESTRNTLALLSSPDLTHWTVRAIVLYHPDTSKHGFQYVDWQFEENDIVAVSRTAHDDEMGGANDMHDANYLTFHRIRDFRTALTLPPHDPQGLINE